MVFRVNVGEKGNFYNIINDWLPDDVRLLGFNVEEREFQIEISSIESIIDIICDVGCTLKFDILCDKPIIYMELD